jgi:SpoVK/Ycf46/Vps4 family AAA+-type ATPase
VSVQDEAGDFVVLVGDKWVPEEIGERDIGEADLGGDAFLGGCGGDAGESCSTSINQNRNCLMQELDRFDGVVIVTTNLFENYDPALLRRIQRHIKFRLPDASMRRELFALHLPNPDRVQADYAVLAELSRGLSGGDILNVCVNAIHA